MSTGTSGAATDAATGGAGGVTAGASGEFATRRRTLPGTGADGPVLHDSPLATATGVVKALCLAYVLWLPVSQTNVLYPVLALLTAVSVFDILTHRTRIPQLMLAGILTLTIAIVYALTVGALRDNPGIEHQTTVWAGSLLIWSMWALGLRPSQLRLTVWTLVIVLGISSTAMMLYIGGETGAILAVIPPVLMETQGAGFDASGGGTAIRFLGLSSLAAGAPLLVALALAPSARPFTPPRWVLLAAATFAVLTSVFAGRRAVMVVALATPLLLVLARALLGRVTLQEVLRHRATPRVLAVLAAALVLLPFLPRRWFAALSKFSADMLASILGIGNAQSISDPSNQARVEQGEKLLDGWGMHPFLGSGAGAVLPGGYVRSLDRPWMFELQYHLWLFTGGAVGVLLSVVAGVILLRALRRVSARTTPQIRVLLMASLAAAIALLVANASNPYLQAVGHWWGIALVFAIAMAAAQVQEPDPASGSGAPGGEAQR